MPSVTIIIPVRNRANFLPRLFHSLSALTYEELEVIFVDNASDDGSLAVCRSFAEEAPFVVRVLEEIHVGACWARNRGLSVCQSEWVYFFDCDDDMSSTFLEDILPALRDKDADVVAFPVMQSQDGKVRKRTFRPSSSVASQILSSTLCTQSMLFRASFLRKIGGWDVRLSIWQDWELGVRVLLHHPRIVWFSQSFHRVNIHSESITGPSLATRRDVLQQSMQIVESLLTAPSDLRALFLRRYIINGLLLRQGGAPIPITSPHSVFLRLLGRLLQSYVYCGGRGAWRMALIFCHSTD